MQGEEAMEDRHAQAWSNSYKQQMLLHINKVSDY